MSTIKVNTIQTVAGVEQYLTKAWANFNGSGTLTVRQSGNASSVTDFGVANYGLNFSSNMPDANYAITGTAEGRDVHPNRTVATAFGVAPTSSSARVYTGMPGGSGSNGIFEDAAFVSIVIHR